MTEEKKDGLYEAICNDINCGTFELSIQFVDNLLAEERQECMGRNKDGTLKPCRVMKDNTTLRVKKENLERENTELKKKLCLMRKYIYGNYDLEYKEMQLQHIDEFGNELKVVTK